jgi:hypothetical protein
MIQVVHPGSGSQTPAPDFLPFPDPGSRGQKGPVYGSATLLKWTQSNFGDVPQYICLKAVTDHLLAWSRVGSFDPWW